jgi:hypothetical protein
MWAAGRPTRGTVSLTERRAAQERLGFVKSDVKAHARETADIAAAMAPREAMGFDSTASRPVNTF